MQSFDEKLKALLKTEPSFLDKDWELLEWKLQDSARNADEKLIKLLITDEEMKSKFFSEIAWYQVFNGNLFIEYISNKNFLDNSYTKYKNKIWLQINGKFLKENGDVSLVRPFKDCVLEWWQTKEDEKKKEIFFNEILAQDEIDKLFAPKVLTNFKKYDKDWEHKVEWFKRDENGTIKDNLIIKWNNLLVLHTLKKEFEWKINLIYIDPPYNTWNDTFWYNDNFNRSSRLTFIKNRLEISKELLSEDGAIYMQLDYNQVHYAKIVMDEVFWEDNFQREIIWRIWRLSWYKTNDNNRIRNHDTILFYSKNKKCLKFIKNVIPNSEFKEYTDAKELGNITKEFKLSKDDNKIIADYLNHWARPDKYYIEDTRNSNEYDDLNSIAIVSFAWETVSKLLNSEDEVKWQKSEKLLERIIKAHTEEWDIVLDFFWWTFTTWAVAHKLNRQYIICEQLEKHIDIWSRRIKKVIEWEQSWISKKNNRQWWWEFIYCELKKYNQEFIEQIEDAKSTDELLKIRENMKEKAYFKYNFDMQKFEENMDYFKNWTNSLKEQKELLVEILNKNQLYVNLSDIDDENFEVSDEDKKLNSDFYSL